MTHNPPSIHYRGCERCYFTGYRFRFDVSLNLPVATDDICPHCQGGGIIYISDSGRVFHENYELQMTNDE